MLALGLPPSVVALGFTLGIALAGALNIAYTVAVNKGRLSWPGLRKSAAVLLGVAAGVAAWAVLDWRVLRWVMAAALIATGVKLLEVFPSFTPRRGALLLNFAVGFLEAMLGAAPAFALARAFFGEVEALIPLMRTAGAAASVSLKHAVVLGGVLMGLGVFLGQRLVHCGASHRLRKVVGMAITATGIYLLTL